MVKVVGAEALDVDVAEDDSEKTKEQVAGKWARKPTTRYQDFWCYRDDVNWESDEDFS